MSIADILGDLKVLYTAATRKAPDGNSAESFGLMIAQNASRWPNETALICEDESVTWQELNSRVNHVASELRAKGIGAGDCVALFMQNRIDFVATLGGIVKLGAVAGLINTNLTRAPLAHCIKLIESKACIFGEELTEALNEIRDELSLRDGEDYLYVADEGNTLPPNWATSLDTHGSSPSNPTETASVRLKDTAFYIFTSGTTGLPKAAVVSHKRVMPAAMMSATMLQRIDQKDRMYNCLPLYHGTGLIIGMASAFAVGASTVIKRRLSVSAFWDDIRQHNCTSFVYIGEFIRYLLSRPEHPSDADNPVRTIVGNGLRPDIWQDFKERFAIDRIGEFYAASEGNGGFANLFNKDATVGLPIAPCALIAYDVAQDEIVRGSDGLCQRVPEGAAGLLLIEVTGKSEFEGYTNAEASEKKLLRNVFEQGDVWFNSGDLMKIVDVGFAYGQKHYQFVDRVGDTFRWKSENVSTNEVGEIVNQHPDIIFTNVYGVTIPGTDGRAGMAAIVFRDDLGKPDLEAISAHVRDNLPSYAQPIFLRILKELPTTSTHKLQKNDLRDQAFHLDKTGDDLYVMRPRETVYTRLDSDYYDQIMRREVAF
ncbi:MAG: long-chain-acyl-CoA synthetase [Gammaproteobacteria bacterium]|nr:long-chain-acyl-CoA synthetase [Gammaproteobacteria bacterium]